MQFTTEERDTEAARLLSAAHIGRAAAGGVDGLLQRLENEGAGVIRPIRLPWRKTDKALGFGLTPGQVTIIAGAAGAAKSYLLLNILRHASTGGARWRLLPLEDDAGRWIQRMLAVYMGSWDMVAQPGSDDESERRRLADFKLNAVRNNPQLVKNLHHFIYENPRLPVTDAGGFASANTVDYRDVLTFLETIGPNVDLVGIDCLSQVDFSIGGLDYPGQAEFMRRVVGIAAATGTHVILVAHNAKGAKGGDPLDAVQGSALFNRLAHNVIGLVRHDPPLSSDLFSHDRPVCEHRHTLSILKSRGGRSGTRIAFDLEADGPNFREYGMIKPKIHNA